MVLCHKKLSKFWLFSMKFENMVAKHAMCFRFLNLIGAAPEDFLKKISTSHHLLWSPFFVWDWIWSCIYVPLLASMVMLQSRIVDWKFSCVLTLWNCQTLFTTRQNFFVKLKSKCLLKHMINTVKTLIRAAALKVFSRNFGQNLLSKNLSLLWLLFKCGSYLSAALINVITVG